MNIYQKLIEVRKEVPYIQKADKGAQYNYTGSSRVLAACKNKMDELGLLLVPAVTGHKLSESPIEFKDGNGNVTKRTTTYFTELEMTMTWINAENPEEKIVSPWYAQGVDIAGEKGVGKALTYGEKYFLLKFFNIATDKDDPDAFQAKHENEPKQERDENLTAIEQASAQNTGKPPASLKAKYQLGTGSIDGFEDWVEVQKNKGRSYRDMEAILQEALNKKKGEAAIA